MNENLLNESGVTVSRVTVRVGDQVFAVRNITSVRVERAPGWSSGCAFALAVWLGLSALSMAFLLRDSGGVACALFPLLAAVGLVVAGRRSEPKSRLIIVTAGGEVNALQAGSAFVVRVADSIVQAISS